MDDRHSATSTHPGIEAKRIAHLENIPKVEIEVVGHVNRRLLLLLRARHIDVDESVVCGGGGCVVKGRSVFDEATGDDRNVLLVR
jgi:hypothetical protein